ncbi:MAG: cyclase family protein [Candidatus Brockarchaeota archaeon]|nr:cyclase family protein [Candidatus Brockarchaeota archaeon]
MDFSKYRVVDLSAEVVPGVLSGERYVHGSGRRRFELRRFVYAPDGTFMNWVETETHVGTHVECPSHYLEGGKDVSSLPLVTFMGEAVVVDAKRKRAEPINPVDLESEGVREGDILLMFSGRSGEDRPFIGTETAKWLVETRVKMVGVDDSIAVEAKGSMATHEYLLGNDIPIIEGLCNLEELRRKRVLFIALPLRVRGLDSSWVRAVALEEL